MSADMSVRDAYQLKDQHGFSGFPVTQNGEMGAKLVGLVTGRDFDFLSSDEYDTAVSEVLRLQPLRLHSRVTCVMCTDHYYTGPYPNQYSRHHPSGISIFSC